MMPPLGLIGFPPEAALALRDLGLVALSVPSDDLQGVVAALRTLRFGGALVAPHLEEAMLTVSQPDAPARRQGGVDALALVGSTHGTHTLGEAVVGLVEQSGYATRGAHLVIVGEGTLLRAGLSLARLGFASVTVAAPSVSEAQRELGALPAGVAAYAMSTLDSSMAGLAGRADLVVLAGSSLPPGVLQPYHTLLDLSGHTPRDATRVGAALLAVHDLPALRLALQLEHATGQRYKAEALADVAAALG